MGTFRRLLCCKIEELSVQRQHIRSKNSASVWKEHAIHALIRDIVTESYLCVLTAEKPALTSLSNRQLCREERPGAGQSRTEANGEKSRDRETKKKGLETRTRIRSSLEWSRALSQTSVRGLIAAAFLLWIMFPLPACWQVAMWLRDPFNTESDAAAQTRKSISHINTHTPDSQWMWIFNPSWTNHPRNFAYNIWKEELGQKLIITHRAIRKSLHFCLRQSLLRVWGSLNTNKTAFICEFERACSQILTPTNQCSVNKSTPAG